MNYSVGWSSVKDFKKQEQQLLFLEEILSVSIKPTELCIVDMLKSFVYDMNVSYRSRVFRAMQIFLLLYTY